MSSSPGLPPQQATTTLQQPQQQQQQQQNHHHHHHHHYHQQQKQNQQQQKKPPLPTVSPSKSPRNNRGGDSEAETVVVQREVPLNARKDDDEASEYERGRRRRAPETRAPADRERPHRTRPLRQGPAKRWLKQEDRDEEYSSDLSSAPSRSSRPNSPSHPMRRRTKHGTGFQKRGANGASTASEGDNSDRDDTHHSRLRLRKRRRSVMDSSPPNLRIKSSPPVSPQPLGSPIKSTRTREKAHAGQRTLKHRKIPPPLVTSRGDLSSSPSRDNSPSSIPPPRQPQSDRAPGSPMSTSHKPKRDTAGRTHLHRACQRGAVAEVEAILEQGKEFLNAEDNAGYLPLHEACLYGRLEVAKILINNGAWLDVPSRIEQDTPLLDAVDNGHADVVKYLLELGADPRKRNKQGQTALDANDSNRETPDVFQEIEGLLKVSINKLRKRPSDDEAARASAAADSHSSRDPSVASPVHQSPPALSIPTGTRRRNARTEQSRKDLLWLDAGKNGLQKLREKAREGDQQMVHALLERGTKPDTESLIGAIKGGHADTVSLLLAYGDTIVDPEPGSSRESHRKTRDNSMPAGEETPMLAAIGRGNLTVLGYLLENGVDPRRLDSKGKSYMDIARDREGEFWQDEVDLLKKAWDKAGGGSRSEKAARRGHSPTNHRNTSPKPKKMDGIKGTISGSRRPNSTLSSANIPQRCASANSPKYEDTIAVSDQEIAAEPLRPPKNRGKKGKRSESDSIAPPVAKKKRRLISGKDLANEESLARSSQEPARLAPSETDIDSSEKKLVKYRSNSTIEEVIKVEQKLPGRKLRVESEDTKRPDNILSSKDKKPTLGGKRDRTRSPTSHSDSGRRPEKDEPRKQRKIVDHKQERYDSDSTVKRVKEEGKLRKLRPTRRDSPGGRRPSVSTTETSEKEEERRRLREQEESERKRQRAGEDEKRRVELRRQEYLKAELESIISKAQDESKASMDQIIYRGLKDRQQREEKDRREKELREEEEEREAEEKEKREREKRERSARRQAAEQEAKEREVRERELKEARDKEARELEVHRLEEERKREEACRLEEERKREEARRLEEERKIEEEFQKKLAEERRKKEERQAALENQRRAEEAERKRKAAEEEVRKRQEFERGRREAELLQQQLALEAERKRLEDEEQKRELARRRALPFALRKVEDDTAPVDTSRFMPLYSAVLPGSYPTANATPMKAGMNGCGPQKAQQYILNVQAALVLGITDLDFSTYPGVRGRDANDQQRLRMWSVLSVTLCESVCSGDRSIEELEKSRKEEREKFLKMEPVFWMKVGDLCTIINTDPKYANLANLVIRTVDVDLSCSSYTTPVKVNSNGNGNGPMTPASASITTEEMALRLQRLFGTPSVSPPQYNQSQAPSTPSPLSSQLSVSMPPPTPVNAANAASTFLN